MEGRFHFVPPLPGRRSKANQPLLCQGPLNLLLRGAVHLQDRAHLHEEEVSTRQGGSGQENEERDAVGAVGHHWRDRPPTL